MFKGDLALALLNTIRWHHGSVVDHIATPPDFTAWLRQGDAVSGQLLPLPEPFGPHDARRLHAEALLLRGAVASAATSLAVGQQPAAHDVDIVDRALRATPTRRRLLLRSGELHVSEEVDSTPMAPLQPFVVSAAWLLTEADASRLRQCASDRCLLWFLDVSRNGRRRWCSMTKCGNRAKAARHRRLDRDSAAATGAAGQESPAGTS